MGGWAVYFNPAAFSWGLMTYCEEVAKAGATVPLEIMTKGYDKLKENTPKKAGLLLF